MDVIHDALEAFIVGNLLLESGEAAVRGAAQVHEKVSLRWSQYRLAYRTSLSIVNVLMVVPLFLLDIVW